MSVDKTGAKSPAGDDTGNTASVMAGVSLKLPPFWRADPQIWFAQAEAQFEMLNITREVTMYSHVVTVLQPDIAQEVRDLLLERPRDMPYTTLKEQLIPASPPHGAACWGAEARQGHSEATLSAKVAPKYTAYISLY